MALAEYLILSAWTLPEVLHAVEHISQCFIICRPQTVPVAGGRASGCIMAATGTNFDIEDFLVEGLQGFQCMGVLLPLAVS